MKKRIRITLIVGLLAVALISGMLFHRIGSSGIKSDFVYNSDDFLSSSDEKWTQVNDTCTLNNENLTLKISAVDTHFVLTDKKSGLTYYSSAEASEDASTNSEVVLTYYDKDSVKNILYSSKNSVDFGAFTVKTDGNAIRVYYTLRKSEMIYFVPSAFDRNTFEKTILSSLSYSQQRRLGMFYKEYLTSDNDFDTTRQKENYKYLKKRDMYILSSDLGESDYKEITELMQEVGYTADQYAEDSKRLSIVDANSSMMMEFTVPVEYRLTPDGFEAEVLTDLITITNDSYIPTNVSLLNAFGMCGREEKASLLIPDGSGAIIETDKNTDVTYKRMIYGDDPVIQNTASVQNVRSVPLPVFGMERENDGYFAVIKSLDSAAYINAVSAGSTNEYSRIYASFDIYPFDLTDVGKDMAIPVYNLYSEHQYLEHPVIRYYLLGKENKNYVSMAKIYRTYLIETQKISEEMLAKKKPSVYLDFIGLSSKQSAIMGVGYSKKITLSTIKGITDALHYLNENGIKNVNIRLKGYSSGETVHGIDDHFAIDGNIGSKSDLVLLATEVKKQNGILFLENDFERVYNNSLFDSFNALNHSARQMNQIVARSGKYDIVSNDLQEKFDICYLVSPRYYRSVYLHFTDSLTKRIRNDIKFGYSTAYLGEYLISDFSPKQNIDRSMSLTAYKSVLEDAKSKYEGVLTEVGNAYVLGAANHIINLPLSDSGFTLATHSIPFYQIALHGYVSFAGQAINTCSDPVKEMLLSAETGAAWYYSCLTESRDVLREADNLQEFLCTSFDDIKNDVVERSKSFTDKIPDLSNCTIEMHSEFDTNVYETVFSDGTAVLVNYNSYDYNKNGIFIEALNFAVQKGELIQQ